ncbi:hypothetical protein THAOC_36836, partial [Thalassiosira oceanica]
HLLPRPPPSSLAASETAMQCPRGGRSGARTLESLTTSSGSVHQGPPSLTPHSSSRRAGGAGLLAFAGKELFLTGVEYKMEMAINWLNRIQGFLLYEGGDVKEALRSKLTRVQIGPQVTEIPNGTFRGCSNLVEVQMNYEGLQTIGATAFESCKSLRSVSLPSTVTKWGYGAFHDCSNLVEVQFNEGLQVIGFGSFGECSALRRVTIPSTVTKLGGYAFFGCSNLAELNEGLQTIGSSSFEDCTALQSVAIPSTVTKLGTLAFHHCSNLSEVILLGGDRLLDQEFLTRGAFSEEQGLLNQATLDEILFGKDGDFAFRDCPLTTVKISIPSALSARMARLPPECRFSVQEGIRNLRRFELTQDGNVFACFSVVHQAGNTFDVEDDLETARSLYQVIQWIAFYELKESSILIELAMWKTRIEGESVESTQLAMWTSRINGTAFDLRTDCRVPIPDPVKSLIMEYCGFLGFLEPVIEGAHVE